MYAFTRLPSWLIRYPIYIGDRQPLEAHEIIYTDYFGTPPRFNSCLIFDYYRLCAINWRFLDVRSKTVDFNLARRFLFPSIFLFVETRLL